MKISGVIESILFSGYERLLSIKTKNMTIWCSGLQCDEYLPESDSSKFLKVNENVLFESSLKLVQEYEIISPTKERGIYQPIQGSPHAIVIGEILEKKDPYEYVLSIHNDESITVEFETAVDLNVTDTIKVAGELVVELD